MSVKVIDVEPRVLSESSEAMLHAAEQSWTHLHAESAFESVGEVASITATLVENGPYAFTTTRATLPSSSTPTSDDGEMRGSLPKPTFASTRQAITEHYTNVHATYSTDYFDPMVEIRGAWYTFFESIATIGYKPTGECLKMPVLVLIPSGSGRGITGEIVWSLEPEAARKAMQAVGETPEIQRPRRFAEHARYLQCLRDGDVDGLLEIMGESPHSIVRDYVDDNGSLVDVEGRDAHREHYEALFAKYQIRSVDFLQRLAQDTYLFAETRITASVTSGSDAGNLVTFHTAEFFVSDEAGVLRMGHGTDPE
jgi:hypothetical protein